MLAEGKVGPPAASLGGGAFAGHRLENMGGLVMQASHARYYEAVYRGNVYAGGNSAAITFGTALTATGVTFHLFNPANSGKNLVVLKTCVAIVTTTTSGTIVYCANSNPAAAAPSTTTAITILNCLVGSGNSPVAKLYSVATLPVAPVQLRPLASAIATAAINAPSSVTDDVNGEFIVTPGCTLSVQGITIAGTGLIGMSWEEVPI